MIKVSVMYPNISSARFDHNYYRERHLPLIKGRMGGALKYYTIDKGLTAAAPGSPPSFVAMCHLICDSVESYASAYDPHAQEIRKDIANFTNIIPSKLISEVVIENSAGSQIA